MQITWMPIDHLKPYENNPRKYQSTIPKLMQSLKTYGWQQPIVVDPDGVIIVGHARWQAAQKLGMTEAPVYQPTHLTDAQIRSYRLADNRLAEESRWDLPSLGNELAALQALEVDLQLTGFRESELNQLLPALTEPHVDTQLTVELDKPAVTQSGDIWLLDHHRVMCGDAAQAEDLAQLMAGASADLLFTDPPYNVGYQPKNQRRFGGSPRHRPMCHDDLPAPAYQQLIQTALTQAALHLQPEASLYLCCADRYIPELRQALTSAGFTLRNTLLWVKPQFVLNYARYKSQHEVILYAHRQGQTDVWYGDAHQSTVWRFDQTIRNDLHPTMKPIPLIQQALSNSTLPGDRVLDVFGGSGSTLIACQAMQRQAFILEIMPHYVDVIVRRWQTLTGKVAVSAQTQLPFPN